MVGAEVQVAEAAPHQDELSRRSQAKPIGWRLPTTQETQRQWEELKMKWSDDWTTSWTMTTMNEKIWERAHLGVATRRLPRDFR